MPINVIVYAGPPVHDVVADEATEVTRTNVEPPRLERLEYSAAFRAGENDLAAERKCLAFDLGTHANTYAGTERCACLKPENQ